MHVAPHALVVLLQPVAPTQASSVQLMPSSQFFAPGKMHCPDVHAPTAVYFRPLQVLPPQAVPLGTFFV